MNKKAFSVAVASVAVAGTIAAPAMADGPLRGRAQVEGGGLIDGR